MTSPARTDAAPPASAPELNLTVENAHAVKFAAVPTLGFDLGVERLDGGAIRSAALNTQVRIAATNRSYAPGERERLVELFGLPEQWGKTLRSLLWMNVTTNVPPFKGSTVFELTIPATYDLEVLAAKYFQALETGDIPLEFLFSGNVFYADPTGRLQVAAISWDQEAECPLPVSVWREMMNIYFGDSPWMRLRRDSFDRLYAYKARRALPTWDDAVEALLSKAEQEEE